MAQCRASRKFGSGISDTWGQLPNLVQKSKKTYFFFLFFFLAPFNFKFIHVGLIKYIKTLNLSSKGIKKFKFSSIFLKSHT